MKQYFVYILTNPTNSVLYIGVTNNLIRRMHEHKTKQNQGFTAKYNCHRLLYYEETNDIYAALTREKQLKAWRRSWKVNLIKELNPTWKDLSSDFFEGKMDVSTWFDPEINSG